MSYYKIKTGGNIKDIDLSNAIVSGYFSKFGNVDSDNDMLMPGAFKKTIKERGFEGKNQIWFLQDHDWSKLLSKPHVLKEDNFGLYYEAKVNDKISYAKDALILSIVERKKILSEIGADRNELKGNVLKSIDLLNKMEGIYNVQELAKVDITIDLSDFDE